MELELTPEERQELKLEFLSEAEAHLNVLNENLLYVEECLKNNEAVADEKINAMFRAAHTVKGVSSTLSYHKISRLTHIMENLMDKVRKKEVDFSQDIIDVLFSSFDILEKIITQLREVDSEEEDIEEPVKKLNEVLDKASAKEKTEDAFVEEEEEEEKKTEFDPSKYMQMFIDDSLYDIEQFNEKMIAFESDHSNKDLLNELFRLMHTLKASAGTIGQQKIQKIAHAMEEILSLLREGKAQINEERTSILLAGVDIIKSIIMNIVNNVQEEVDIDDILDSLIKNKKNLLGEPASQAIIFEERILEIKQLSKEDKDQLKLMLEEEKDIFEVSFIIDTSIQMKPAKLVLAEERLKKEGMLISLYPASDIVPDDYKKEIHVSFFYASVINEKDIHKKLLLDGIKNIEIIRKDIADLKKSLEEKIKAKTEDPKDKTKKVPEKKTSAKTPVMQEMSTVRIDVRKLDDLLNLAGELVITRARFAQMVQGFYHTVNEGNEVFTKIENIKAMMQNNQKQIQLMLGQKTQFAVIEKMEKVFSDFDMLMEWLEEKSTAHQFKSYIRELDEITGGLGKLSSDIQSGVMQTRMIPVEGVFNRFKRVVRDLSKDLNKKIQLVIEGEETELDKKVIDSLGDPLTHIVRNAVDHGIENPQKRKEQGKPEIATVVLRAYHSGNNICIEVKDDGGGIDSKKISEKAIEKEMVTQEALEKMSEKEILNLLFLPGFSTAEKVTGVSGRGVGMDVVIKMIESIKGAIDIKTTLGEGTVFTLKIPLTLAIIQALLVDIAGEKYAIPIESVVEIFKISQKDIYSIDGKPTVKIRNNPIGLLELSDIIGIANSRNRASKIRKVVLISDGENKIGISVDELIGEDEIVIKSLSKHFEAVKGISGASIQGDGSIALILDPPGIIRKI
ncbi:MAG: chemotaxis protein CheA [Candidatus Aureabacteria bacterium]|nr:chemotaxis protein CheA [Candidatus Auribacterota bacterium]